jgi:predicted ABC-type ATPase
LIILRGNSGSGKSSIAREVRARHGRGIALVEQDYLRRIVLRERDQPGGHAAALIAQTVRFALDIGYHVICEGILHSARYRPMLDDLRRAHRGTTLAYYIDV